MKKSFQVTLDVPPGVENADVTYYIQQAIASYGGGLAPDHPLFAAFDRRKIKVAPESEPAVVRERVREALIDQGLPGDEDDHDLIAQIAVHVSRFD